MSFRFGKGHSLVLLAIAALVLLSIGSRPASTVDSAGPVPETPQLTLPSASLDSLEHQPPASFEVPAALATGPEDFQDSADWQRELRLSARGARQLGVPAASTPTSTFVAQPLTGAVSVPILMYHHIAEPGPGADAIRRDLSVSPLQFAAQLDYLARAGFHVIALSDLIDHLSTSRPLPTRPVVLTFDDGYLDNYTTALPLLRARGFTGTFFLITDFLGHGEYMTWDNARELKVAGMELGSHTLDHPDLSQLSAARLSRQLSESRQVLEAQLGAPVLTLCYPAGRYSAGVKAAAAKAGYIAAVTTVYGDSHRTGDKLELSRVRISGHDSTKVFAAKVRGPEPASLVDRQPSQTKGQ